jgi:hypothetical protein
MRIRIKIPKWMAKRWKWTAKINKDFQEDMDNLVNDILAKRGK